MMIKTKLTTAALAAFVGIAAPGWSTDGKVTPFNDTGLTNLKITQVIPRENGYGVKMAGTRDREAEFFRIPASEVEFVGWENKDEKLLALKKIKAIVDCTSGTEITGAFTLDLEHPYTILKQAVEITEGNWFPLGNTRTTYSVAEYERPDKTVFIDKKVLYTKAMEETGRNPLGPLNSYRGEEVQTTYRGGFLKNPGGKQETRYFWNQSDQTSISVIIKKTFPDGRVEREDSSIIKIENTRALGGDYGDAAIRLNQLDSNKYWVAS